MTEANVVNRLAATLAVLLLAGTILLGIGAVMHPVLAGDAGSQLRLIADSTHWRALHLTMLAGSALVAAGVWVRLVLDRPANVMTTLPPLALISIGVVINALNIGYMAGAGWHMAELFEAGRTETIAVFEMTHPIGLIAARFGNLIVALGALALGWVEWREPRSPRWLAWLAWMAAAGGLVGVAFFDESSRLALAAVGLLSGWQVVTAWRVLAGGQATPAPADR